MFRVGSRFARLSFVSIVATSDPRRRYNEASLRPGREIVKSPAGFAQACDRFLQVGGEGKVKLLSRRQYVIDCVQALKDRPQVNVPEVLNNHPDLKSLPCSYGPVC